MVDSPYPELKKTHTMARVGRPYTDRKPPAAAPVWDVIEGYGRFHALNSALELGVFDVLAEIGPAEAGTLALRLDVSPTHLETLLEGVVAMGLLDRRHRSFELNDTARRYLVSDSPASMASLVPVSPGPLENWHRLTDTVRTGAPVDPVDDDASFHVPLVEGTFTTINRCAMRADRQLRYSALTAPRVLELGAGGAPWSIAVLESRTDATAVVNDLDGVLGVARRTIAERGLLDRVEFRAGDFHHIDVESAGYDLVVLGHICRTEGEAGTRSLMQRSFDALRPGGRVLIGDYFCDEQRSQAGHALMMGVTMMASTRRGRTFTHGQIGAWLTDAGFEAVRCIEPIGFQEVFVGVRPSAARANERGARR
ncbi:methyltransferase family protein [Ilumatobacter nonamiensis]|uniref:methyltransferase family protein n=1 Tax=Ilumatobacter nonamiensis TaxID=467093 RepID=UPI000345D7B8|nr:methyltransferase dimerization domain-containing protein [Ilumatobacter nonamiensis]